MKKIKRIIYGFTVIALLIPMTTRSYGSGMNVPKEFKNIRLKSIIKTNYQIDSSIMKEKVILTNSIHEDIK